VAGPLNQAGPRRGLGVLYAPCVTHVCRSRLYAPARHSPPGGLATVIGTLLILWLGVGLAVWLLWAVSRLPTLLIGLTARIRRRWHVTLGHKFSAQELVHKESSWQR
jgi:hypothetical protein